MINVGVLQAVLRLKDEFGPKIKMSGDELKRFAAASVAAFAVFAAGAKKALDAYSVQQDALLKLNLALANQGNLLPGVSGRLSEYASELQRSSIFGDEVILKNQALLASFGMNEAQLKVSTQAALDFASATGRDLTQAVNLLGKAFVGETGELSRYGIIIEEGLSKTEKFDAVIGQMTTRFAGSAQLATATFTGQMAQLKNASGDVLEELGKLVTFLVSDFAGGAQSSIAILEGFGRFFGQTLPTVISEARALFAEFVGSLFDWGGAVSEFLAKIPGMSAVLPSPETLQYMAERQRDLALSIRETSDEFINAAGVTTEFTNNASQLAAAVDAVVEAESNAAADTDRWGEALRRVNHTMPPITASVEEMAVGFEENMTVIAATAEAQSSMIEGAFHRFGFATREEVAATLRQLEQDFATLSTSGKASADQIKKAWEKLETFRQESSEETTGVFLSQGDALVSGAGQIFSVLGQKYKAAAIAGAIISTYQGIAKAHAAAPWPANLVLMAGAAAVGFANVAKIKGSQAGFQEGTPGLGFTDFGRESMVPLHGREAVIPEHRSGDLADQIASRLGGGGTTIQVSFNIKDSIGFDSAAAKRLGDIAAEQIATRYSQNPGGLRTTIRGDQ